MTGIIFLETLRRKWREMLYWGMGVFIWALYPFLMIPDQAGLDQYAELVESLDSNVARAVGISSAASIATPEGFIGYAFFAYILLILGVYAVLAGLNITIAEEDKGILDVFLALPVRRWQVIAEKMLAYTVMIFGIAFIAFVGLLVGSQLTSIEVTIPTGRYFASAMNIVPSTLLILAFTVFVSTLVRRQAGAIAGGFVVISYIINIIGNVSDSTVAQRLADLSFFEHFDGGAVLANGIELVNVIGLAAVALVLVVLAIGLFERRDIAV